MHEARIVVKNNAGTTEITLIDVSGGETELAKESSGDYFAQGFADMLNRNGEKVTAALVQAAWAEQESLKEIELFGRYLYRLLTPGKIAEKWQSLKLDCEDGDETLTTLLEIEPPAWQALPWELLYEKRYLFHDKSHAMGLRIPGGRARKASYRWPLRMLLIIGCGPQENGISWEDELLAIRRALCDFSLRVDLKVLRAPLSKQTASQEIEKFRPHLFHFIGHGTSDDGGSLLLMDEVEEPKENGKRSSIQRAWTRDDLSATLSGLGNEIPRLAFINACQSAGQDGSLDESSVAQAFALIGCPAMIAMRGDILGQAAVEFARSFYQGLAKLGLHRVDQAYSRALGTLGMEGIDQRVWSLPRLYFQENAQNVFRPNDDNRGFDQVAKGFTDLPTLKPFINHEDLRFELYHEVDCWLDAPDFQVLLIHGPERSGKSWLLNAIVYAATLRGYRACYRDFKGPHLELETFLAQLRAGNTQGRPLLSGPLESGDDSEPFAEFDNPATNSVGPGRGSEDLKRPLVERFALGLRNAAASGNLILAVDHIASLQPCWDYIRGPIFEAAARGSGQRGLGANLRLILAANAVEMSQFELLSLHCKVIQLGDLSPRYFKDYVEQYLLHRLEEDENYATKLSECRDIIDLLAKKNEKYNLSWRLGSLDSIYELVGA